MRPLVNVLVGQIWLVAAERAFISRGQLDYLTACRDKSNSSALSISCLRITAYDAHLSHRRLTIPGPAEGGTPQMLWPDSVHEFLALTNNSASSQLLCALRELLPAAVRCLNMREVASQEVSFADRCLCLPSYPSNIFGSPLRVG